MAALTGSLSSFGVTSLVRFLCGLGKSGDLLLSRGPWIGQLSLERGRLSAASVEDDLGPAALEFIVGALRDGEFEFTEGAPGLAPNLDPGADHLAELDRASASAPEGWTRQLPAPTVIPYLVQTRTPDESDLVLGRATVYVLLEIDGSRNVRTLGSRLGLVRSLKALAQLRELGLITFEEPSPSPAQPVPPAGSVDGPLDPPAAPPPGPPAEPSQPLASRRAYQSEFRLEPRAAPSVRERFADWRARVAGRRSFAMVAELTQAVVVTGVLIVGLRSVVQNFRVEGISMEPTFDGGQALIVNRAAYLHVEHTPLAAVLPTTDQGSTSYLFGGPQRGDIAVFRAPPEPGADYIKRIIGLPGESVLIQQGQVFINGQNLDEPYIDYLASYSFPTDGRPMVVPDGNYFVLGDNRPESFDSHLGWVVPVDNLIGRAWLRYWPPDELGVVKSVEPVRASQLASR